MMRGYKLEAVAIFASLFPAVAVAQDTSFADTPLGVAPKYFESMQTGPGEPGRWEIVEDDTDTGRTGARPGEPGSERQPFSAPDLHGATCPADVEVRAKLRPVAGRIDQAGGLAVRLLDPDNYYVVRANALEGNVRFYKVVDGKREQLAGANIPIASNRWHELILHARGERFTVTFDGEELFSVTDRTFGSPGKVAFWTKADSVTRFDSLVIKSLR